MISKFICEVMKLLLNLSVFLCQKAFDAYPISRPINEANSSGTLVDWPNIQSRPIYSAVWDPKWMWAEAQFKKYGLPKDFEQNKYEEILMAHIMNDFQVINKLFFFSKNEDPVECDKFDMGNYGREDPLLTWIGYLMQNLFYLILHSINTSTYIIFFK